MSSSKENTIEDIETIEYLPVLDRIAVHKILEECNAKPLATEQENIDGYYKLFIQQSRDTRDRIFFKETTSKHTESDNERN